MPAKQQVSTPRYRRQKARPHDRAFVELNGHRHYLGRHNSHDSRQRYDRLIAQWLAGGRQLPVDPLDITIVELCAQYWEHAKGYYRDSEGMPTSTLAKCRMAMRPLTRLYSQTPASHFGPLDLRAIRETMIEAGGKSRDSINETVSWIRGIFRWAAGRELIPVQTFTALTAVEPLRQGRSKARETEPDGATREKHYQLALAHVKAAEFLGAKTVRIDTGGREPAWTREEFDVIVGRSREFARRAADGGYRFGPEVHWGAELDPANLERLAIAVDNPGFGLLLHLGRYQNSAPLEGDRRLAKWAMHTHVDATTIRDRLDATLELLAQSGYQGSLSVEDGSGTHEYATVAIMLAQVRAGLGRLRHRVAQGPTHPENPLLAPGTQK